MNHKKIQAILAAVLAVAILGALSIYGMGDYGWTVFIYGPFLLGFIPGYLVGKKEDLTKKDSLNLGFLALFVSTIAMLFFALEGMICIIMASPLLIGFTWLGTYVAYRVNTKNKSHANNTLLIVLACSILSLGFDFHNEAKGFIPVQTTITINAPIEEVWDQVVTFDQISEPTEWYFKTGIAYPTNATIEGRGVGAIRYCNFTTGPFVEPITVWEEPTLLAFDVKKHPTPMQEVNPFGEAHPPHLEGYFHSQKGQFRLMALQDNQTLIEGTTWYKLDLYPVFYWKIWSDYIIHKIHLRVLNHIKMTCEKN